MEMANKDKILLSFQSINGTIRLLIATIVFGMGVDCKGVHSVYILYHGILLAHVDGYMKQYVKTNHCRRKELFKHFNCTT